jgi:hypothetical protein
MVKGPRRRARESGIICNAAAWPASLRIAQRPPTLGRFARAAVDIVISAKVGHHGWGVEMILDVAQLPGEKNLAGRNLILLASLTNVRLGLRCGLTADMVREVPEAVDIV